MANDARSNDLPRVGHVKINYGREKCGKGSCIALVHVIV